MQIIHLAGPGFSGRGVKLRTLTPDQKDAAYVSAAKKANDDPKAFIPLRSREGVVRMLVAVTDPQPDIEAVRTAKWHPCTMRDLEEVDGERSLDRIFTCKDVDVLSGIFLRQHEATVGEVDAILGKAISLSE